MSKTFNDIMFPFEETPWETYIYIYIYIPMCMCVYFVNHKQMHNDGYSLNYSHTIYISEHQRSLFM